MKKQAFTLAEVLITMAIIGVLAMVTVPALFTNINRRAQETAIKKAHDTITKAVAMYMIDENVENLIATDISKDSDSLANFINNYFDVVTNCHGKYVNTENKEYCFANDIATLDKSEFINLASGSCDASVILTDGISMCAYINQTLVPPEEEEEEQEEQEEGEEKAPDPIIKSEKRVISIDVDTNNVNGPNVSGRDVFTMDIHPDGTVYDSTWKDRNKDEFVKYYKVYAEIMPIGLIQHNNWRMNY